MNLNKDHRAAMVDDAVKHALQDRKDALNRKLQLFADALHQHAFGKDLPKLANVPKNWLSYATQISVECDYFSYRGSIDQREGKPYRWMEMSEARPLPITGRNADELKIGKGHPFYKEAGLLSKEAVQLWNDEQELRSELSRFQQPFKTLAKLKAGWPEGEKFWPEESQPEHLPVDHKLALKINKMLGIKPGVQV